MNIGKICNRHWQWFVIGVLVLIYMINSIFIKQRTVLERRLHFSLKTRENCSMEKERALSQITVLKEADNNQQKDHTRRVMELELEIARLKRENEDLKTRRTAPAVDLLPNEPEGCSKKLKYLDRKIIECKTTTLRLVECRDNLRQETSVRDELNENVGKLVKCETELKLEDVAKKKLEVELAAVNTKKQDMVDVLNKSNKALKSCQNEVAMIFSSGKSYVIDSSLLSTTLLSFASILSITMNVL